MTRILSAFPARSMRRSQGQLLTFSGIEGAGKSTLVRSLVEVLHERGEQPVMIWSRPGYTPRLNALKRVVRRRPVAKAEQGSSYPTGASAFPNTLMRRLWLTLVLLDMFWLYIVQVRQLLSQGKLVICDRYLTDALIDMRTNFPHDQVERWLFWRLLNYLAPVPSHSFLVLVPLRVSLQRHIERGQNVLRAVERLQRRLELYLTLASAPDVTVVDGRDGLSHNLNVLQSQIFFRNGS